MTYLGKSGLKVLTATGIDGKTLGSTLIQTTAPGLRFVPTVINMELTTVSGFVSAPSVSIGTNSTDYNNLLSITSLSFVDTANEFVVYNIEDVVASPFSIAASTGIYLKVTTAAVGTTYTMRATVLGFYY